MDELISPFDERWVLELYGDVDLVLRAMHYTMASRSRDRRVYVLLNMEFSGLDTLYLVKLCRVFNCKLNNIVVARAFRLSDTIMLLESLTSTGGAVVLVLLPYSYVSKDPANYTEATRVTGLISKIALRNQVVVYNTTSKFGRYMPEGGSFHHHVVKVIVRLSRRGRSVVAVLVKHPVKNYGARSIPLVAFEHPIEEKSTRSILEWVVAKRQ